MAKAEITVAEVTAAEAALIDAKKDRKWNPQKVKDESDTVATLRRAYREQEILAGRRNPGVAVAGDAEKVGG